MYDVTHNTDINAVAPVRKWLVEWHGLGVGEPQATYQAMSTAASHLVT